MRIFLTGVSCVGKTTVGTKLAALLVCPFFDLDNEIESFFTTPIEHLQDKLCRLGWVGLGEAKPQQLNRA